MGLGVDTACELPKTLSEYGSKGGIYLGRIVSVPLFDAIEFFNFTLPKGKGTGLWTNFLSALENNGYKVQKVDESLEISPVDQAYYSLTQKQKEEMEARIKQGLASVASAVSDYEMLAHDLRKYKDFLKMLETGDEHSLRSIFIDEVDINTGANSIKQIVARWPTIIADFMTLGEKMPEEDNMDKIKDTLKISKAEAVILSTKQRLYKNWKEIFGGEVKGRVKRLMEQVNSRKKSIDKYKEWLRPLIARHKLYKEGLSSEAGRKGTFSSQWVSPGQAVSINEIEIWAWQPIMAMESRTGTTMVEKGKGLEPDDQWTRENLIFDEEKGLKKHYKWLSNEWINNTIKEIKEEMMQGSLYYILHQVKNLRIVIRTPEGVEMEDLNIYTQAWLLSQNALLVMLLELKAREQEFEEEINQLLGITSEESEKTEEGLEKIIEKWKKENKEEKKRLEKLKKTKTKLSNISKKVSGVMEKLGFFNIILSRLGPYEHNFKERITEQYASNIMKNFYGPHVVSFLLEEAGVGK